jgi:hypothetical protein
VKVEWNQRLRRVDVLDEKKVFAKLMIGHLEDAAWRLHLQFGSVFS